MTERLHKRPVTLIDLIRDIRMTSQTPGRELREEEAIAREDVAEFDSAWTRIGPGSYRHLCATNADGYDYEGEE